MLLAQVGIPFIVIPPTADEAHPIKHQFAEATIGNATLKARSVRDRAEGRIILGADTIVDLDGDGLGKPKDGDDAFRMLTLLSGRTHRVHTGIVLINGRTGEERSENVITEVTFRRLPTTEIEDYIATGEPFDKAGAYGIQERGALLIERVNGCFFNVMGLPIARLWELLRITSP